jgi:V8-like Glu-specific endopeptidase
MSNGQSNFKTEDSPYKIRSPKMQQYKPVTISIRRKSQSTCQATTLVHKNGIL